MSTRAERDQDKAEAGRWTVRLSDAPRPEDLAAFEAWRRSSPGRELAYEREYAAWRRLDRLASLRPSGGDPDPELLSAVARPQAARAAQPPMRTRWAAVAAALLLVVGLGSTLILSVLAAPAYATGIGERRLVVLRDGTQVELNTNTKIVVRYSRRQREVELVRGEAMLHIAAGARPFLLRTDTGRFRAPRPADVDVRMVDATTQVAVRQGWVEALDDAASTGRIVGSGAQATIDEAAVSITPVAEAELDRRLSWRQGAIALDGETIAAAVAEINRYNDRQIIVGDRGTGNMRVGGYFQTLDADAFATALSKAFRLDLSRDADGNLRIARSRAAPAGSGG